VRGDLAATEFVGNRDSPRLALGQARMVEDRAIFAVAGAAVHGVSRDHAVRERDNDSCNC